MDKQKLIELVPLLLDDKTKKKAFADLVSLTKNALYWHIRRMLLVHEDADDVLQNTYLKAWKSIDTFRGSSSPFTWLYKIATNETLTFMAQQRLRNNFSSMDYEDMLLSKMESDVYYNGDEMQRKFRHAIMQLPEKQRLVFNMRYFDDMKYEQMSEITGTSVGALKASYHIAVSKIEQFIKNAD